MASHDYAPRSITIQLIFITIDPQLYVNEFDFSIVKNIYQRRVLTTAIESSSSSTTKYYPSLIVHDFEGILAKTMIIERTDQRLIQRLYKYISRGFRIRQTSILDDMTILKYLLLYTPPPCSLDIKPILRVVNGLS